MEDLNFRLQNIIQPKIYLDSLLILNFQRLPNGDYSAILHINGFTEADAQKKFSLAIENDLGKTDYKVMLSMDEAPKG